MARRMQGAGAEVPGLLRLIHKHPVVGLAVALSLEAWLALPGEAMIAAAAAVVVHRSLDLLRLTAGGVAGMVVNDLILYALSRVGRGVLVHWIGQHTLQFHLSAAAMMGTKFLPPLRSAACVIYGLQGTTLGQFLEVSLLSSMVWIAVYAVIGRSFHSAIARLLRGAERHGRWMTFAEVALTLGLIAVVWI